MPDVSDLSLDKRHGIYGAFSEALYWIMVSLN
jgi:hypothetical protein